MICGDLSTYVKPQSVEVSVFDFTDMVALKVTPNLSPYELLTSMKSRQCVGLNLHEKSRDLDI